MRRRGWNNTTPTAPERASDREEHDAPERRPARCQQAGAARSATRSGREQRLQRGKACGFLETEFGVPADIFQRPRGAQRWFDSDHCPVRNRRQYAFNDICPTRLRAVGATAPSTVVARAAMLFLKRYMQNCTVYCKFAILNCKIASGRLAPKLARIYRRPAAPGGCVKWNSSQRLRSTDLCGA